jgi:hypothetical protein
MNSTLDDELEAAEAINGWLSEARTVTQPTGDDSVPLLVHSLR